MQCPYIAGKQAEGSLPVTLDKLKDHAWQRTIDAHVSCCSTESRSRCRLIMTCMAVVTAEETIESRLTLRE